MWESLVGTVKTFAAVVMMICLSGADRPKGIPVGDKVPDFTVIDLDGKSWKLSTLHEKAGLKERGPVVLTFWCSFCGSCRQVESSLDKLATANERKAAVFALDASAGESADKVAKVARDKKLSLSILMDGEGQSADVFGTRHTTTTVVIDSQGVLRYCGQFEHGKQQYLKDALAAVLAGDEVRVKKTPHHG